MVKFLMPLCLVLASTILINAAENIQVYAYSDKSTLPKRYLRIVRGTTPAIDLYRDGQLYYEKEKNDAKQIYEEALSEAMQKKLKNLNDTVEELFKATTSDFVQIQQSSRDSDPLKQKKSDIYTKSKTFFDEFNTIEFKTINGKPFSFGTDTINITFTYPIDAPCSNIERGLYVYLNSMGYRFFDVFCKDYNDQQKQIGFRFEPSKLEFICINNDTDDKQIRFNLSNPPLLFIDDRHIYDNITLIITEKEGNFHLNYTHNELVTPKKNQFVSTEFKHQYVYTSVEKTQSVEKFCFGHQFNSLLQLGERTLTAKDFEPKSNSDDIADIAATEKIYTFFKNSLYLWATLQNKKVSLENKELAYVDYLQINLRIEEKTGHLMKVPVKNQINPEANKSSWFSFKMPNLQRIKSWLRQKASYFSKESLTIMTGLGIATGGLLWYARNPNYSWNKLWNDVSRYTGSSRFKAPSATPAQAPVK